MHFKFYCRVQIHFTVNRKTDLEDEGQYNCMIFTIIPGRLQNNEKVMGNANVNVKSQIQAFLDGIIGKEIELIATKVSHVAKKEAFESLVNAITTFKDV
jgi:hypothetical protein